MNHRIVAKYLGIVALLIGGSMLSSLPWAFPWMGRTEHFAWKGFHALVGSLTIALLIGCLLLWWGRHAHERLFRREAMAVVGLSWLLATLLGALPFLLSHTMRQPDVPMTVADALFESASGFSGTGATVLTDLEDPAMVSRPVLFWRSMTHFLGGLGIMVLFVAILGQGSAGKALMQAELPGAAPETEHQRGQHAAWIFSGIYLGMNAVLTTLLMIEGMTLFDALCHSFGTVATGGFGTYNNSIEHFHSVPIEATITIFMIVACTNFTLLYYVCLFRPRRLLADAEFRVYIGIFLVVTALVVAFGLRYHKFASLGQAIRYSSFQVASIITNTGFTSTDFDRWNEFGRGALFLLMFVGGCAGSTSCSIKVIRYILLAKILRIEIEKNYRPTVVRTLRVGDRVVEDQDVRTSVLVYFCVILLVVAFSWMFLIVVEPDTAWVAAGHTSHEKLIDCASGVAATINGVGPGLGTAGPARNYSQFQPASKVLFTWLMLLGRLEVFALLVLFLLRFWRGT